MKKMSIFERLQEFCEIVCGLEDYDWQNDFADESVVCSEPVQGTHIVVSPVATLPEHDAVAN